MRRILSIDGGGIKGVFAASFLAQIEDGVDGSIGDYFDLIAGTSTGGIIAIGLGMGLTARELTTLYEVEGPRIFAGQGLLRSARRLVLTKYDPASLRGALEGRLGDRQLWESRSRLLIPALSQESEDIYIYKTPHHDDLRTDWRVSAVDAALATSAAPTYFPAARAGRGPALLDGGLWANNPVGLACVEAVGRRLRWNPEDIRVLSISCTSEPPRRSAVRSSGLAHWAMRILGLTMDAQSRGAVGIAKNLLGPDRVTRIDPTVPRGRYRLDGVDDVPSLVGLGAERARHHCAEITELFLGEPAERFQPCHRPRHTDERSPNPSAV